MKNYLKLLFVALFATMSFAFTACGDDDKDEPSSNSTLVGTWDMVKTTIYYMGDTDVDYPKNVYWVFTSDKLTVHDVNDFANEKEVSYNYNSDSKELKITGYPLYNVTELTDSKLVISTKIAEGWTQTNEFKKRK